MDERVLIYSAAVAVQVLLAIGQIFLKLLAGRLSLVGWDAVKGVTSFVHVSEPAAAVVLAYALAIVLWIYVLQNIPLNRAFLFTSLSFIFVPLVSRLFLGEVISSGTIVGTLLIVGGITVGVFF